jgi:hypothetical protein
MQNTNKDFLIKDLQERRAHVILELRGLEALPWTPERFKRIEFLKQEALHLREGIKDAR